MRDRITSWRAAPLRRSLWLLSAVPVVLQAVYCLTIPAGMLDDGIQVVGAMLVELGMRPNIDFDSVYPPLNSYLLSLAFSLLGQSTVTYHLVQLCAAWITYASIVVGVVLLRPRDPRAEVAAPIIVLCLAVNAMLPTLQAATALAQLSVATVLYLAAQTRAGAQGGLLRGAAGILVATLLWTRPNFALYFLAAFGLHEIARMLDARANVVPRRGQERDARAARTWLFGVTWFAVPLVAVLVGLVCAWGGSLSDLTQQVVFALYNALRDVALHPVPASLSWSGIRQLWMSGLLLPLLPLGWLAIIGRAKSGLLATRVLLGLIGVLAVALFVIGAWQPVWLPVLTSVPTAMAGLHLFRERDAPRDEAFVLLLLSLLCHYVLSRPDGSHLFATFPTITLLLALRAGQPARPRLPALALLTSAIVLFSAVYNWRNIVVQLSSSAAGLRALPALLTSNDAALFGGCNRYCTPHIADPDELAAASYVRARTTPQERVFSGLQQHGSDSPNDMRLYWLMRRPAGARSIMLLWGVTSQPERQRAIAEELDRNHVRWAVLWAGAPEKVMRSSPDAPLDRFFQKKFRLERRFGKFEVWKRPEPPAVKLQPGPPGSG